MWYRMCRLTHLAQDVSLDTCGTGCCYLDFYVVYHLASYTWCHTWCVEWCHMFLLQFCDQLSIISCSTRSYLLFMSCGVQQVLFDDVMRLCVVARWTHHRFAGERSRQEDSDCGPDCLRWRTIIWYSTVLAAFYLLALVFHEILIWFSFMCLAIH